MVFRVCGLALCAVLATAGCATIVSGTSQSITVLTEKGVEGARCELTDSKGGKWYVPDTPGTVTVRKGDGPMTIVCKKAGFKTATHIFDETLHGATFGNIIAGGGVGILVDAASGAAQRYPDQVTVWMEPEAFSTEAQRLAWKTEKLAAEKAEAERQSPPAAAPSTH